MGTAREGPSGLGAAHTGSLKPAKDVLATVAAVSTEAHPHTQFIQQRLTQPGSIPGSWRGKRGAANPTLEAGAPPTPRPSLRERVQGTWVTRSPGRPGVDRKSSDRMRIEGQEHRGMVAEGVVISTQACGR